MRWQMFTKHFNNNFMIYVSQIIVFYTLSVYSAACHFSTVQFNCSVVSSSLWPHGHPCIMTGLLVLHHLPNLAHWCPLSQWYHSTISSNHLNLLLQPSIFPSIRVFSNESFLCIRWPKYSVTTWLNFLISNLTYHIIKKY